MEEAPNQRCMYVSSEIAIMLEVQLHKHVSNSHFELMLQLKLIHLLQHRFFYIKLHTHDSLELMVQIKLASHSLFSHSRKTTSHPRLQIEVIIY
jgi:hypothetical protein